MFIGNFSTHEHPEEPLTWNAAGRISKSANHSSGEELEEATQLPAGWVANSEFTTASRKLESVQKN